MLCGNGMNALLSRNLRERCRDAACAACVSFFLPNACACTFCMHVWWQ